MQPPLRFSCLAAVVAFSWLPILGAAQDAPSGPPPAHSLVMVSVGAKADLDRALEAAGIIAAEIAARDLRLVARDEATRLFNERESSTPPVLPKNGVEVLGKCSYQALYQVATGEREKSRKTVEQCLEPVEPALEAYNRDTAVATKVFDTCMYGTRAALELGNQDEAYAQALRCRRLVPDVLTDEHKHPPEVVALMQKADADIKASAQGTLRVESAPSKCAVYINGRRRGSTPYVGKQFAAGPYRLQVECNPEIPGRVHRIYLGARPITLRIDTVFEQFVRTDGRIRLEYQSTETEERRRMTDARRVGQATGAESVFIVTPVDAAPEAPRHSKEEGYVVRLDRLDTKLGVIAASAWLRVHKSGKKLLGDPMGEALPALQAGRSLDLSSGGTTRAMRAWAPPTGAVRSSAMSGRAAARRSTVAASSDAASTSAASSPFDSGEPGSSGESEGSDAPSSGPSAAAWILGAAGLAGLGAAWTMYGVGYGNEDSRSSLEVPMLLSGGAGAAMLTAAVPMMLPETDGVPWWVWPVGAVGAGLTAYGIYELAADGDCTGSLDIDGVCTEKKKTGSLGALLIFQAVPFLAVPVTYAVRELLGHEGSPAAAIRLGPSRAELMLSGSF